VPACLARNPHYPVLTPLTAFPLLPHYPTINSVLSSHSLSLFPHNLILRSIFLLFLFHGATTFAVVSLISNFPDRRAFHRLIKGPFFQPGLLPFSPIPLSLHPIPST
jgi:hypothetical protein